MMKSEEADKLREANVQQMIKIQCLDKKIKRLQAIIDFVEAETRTALIIHDWKDSMERIQSFIQGNLTDEQE